MAELTAAEQKALERKRRKDEKTLQKYEEQLKNRRQEYKQYADTYALTGRKNRAAAVGECVIKLMENLNKLKTEKNLLDGSLFWVIDEQRVKDTDGRKGFRYVVMFAVKSDEPMFTKEQIAEEIGKTRELLEKETREMFGITEEQAKEEPKDKPCEEDLVPKFQPDIPDFPEEVIDSFTEERRNERAE